jgi:ubiquinone/menaquinone biosynthesis C-methylase UbiE
MSKEVNHYGSQYSNFKEQLYEEIRAELYEVDIGQNSWVTVDEQDMFIDWLNLNRSKKLLDVACGSGETTLRICETTKCSIVGVDIQAEGIKTAQSLTIEKDLEKFADFRLLDGSQKLPFETGSFDVIICIDAINHLPDRMNVFSEWNRILKDDGQLLFTDPIVVTGMLTKDEIEKRASIGYFLFVADGVNEKLLKKIGFNLLKKVDRTKNMALTARRWQIARENRKDQIEKIEEQETYKGQQEFFDTCACLAEEKHLSRFAYLATKS